MASEPISIKRWKKVRKAGDKESRKEREGVRHDSYKFITNAYEHVRLYVSAL